MARVEGELKHGLKIGDTVHKKFALREVSMGEMFDAEEKVPPARQLAYRAALLTYQLEYLGEYKGPFDLQMLRKLKPGDYNILMDAQDELSEETEKVSKN